MTTAAARQRTGVPASWRALRTGFRLGWHIDSTWADPWLFFVYSIARPLGGALILVFMYVAVSASDRGPMLSYFIVGTAFWPMVLGGTQGMAQTVVEDREQWRTTRYVYTAPVPWPAYLVGRALSRTASQGVPAAIVTLAVAAVALGVRPAVDAAGLAYASTALALGMVAILAVGLASVAVAVSVASEAWRLPEAVSAALYLVSGAIFPPALLPGPLEGLAAALPLTWWLECLRRGLLGEGAHLGFPALGDGAAILALAASTAVWSAAAWVLFRHADRRARTNGILDRESGF